MKHPLLHKTILSAAFTCSALSALATDTPDPLPAEKTYWKTEYLDTVLAIQPCEDQGVCGQIYWLNAQDKKIFDYFGDSGSSSADIQQLCGFSPRMSFAKAAENKWSGTMDIRGFSITVDMDVTLINPDKMKVVMSKLLFTKEETWHRVDKDDPRYPACKAPSP